jgi:hypothetical protein
VIVPGGAKGGREVTGRVRDDCMEQPLTEHDARTRRGALPAALLLGLALAGCAGAPHRDPVPEAAVDTAAVPGFGAIRKWGDVEADAAQTDARRIYRQQLAAGLVDATWDLEMLSLSGGGADGAFGAGLLVGWSAAGDRPEFDIVTGVSTGALIAPFAFLGPAYDEELKLAFTTTSTPEIIRLRGFLRSLFSESFADSTPFRTLLGRYIDRPMLDAIAREHARGRRLYIATTHLDAKRPVHWDIGAIAASGRPDALELVHQVILASTSIPALFPPVMVDVDVAGTTHDELHVDGGTVSQFLLLRPGFRLQAIEDQLGREVRLTLYLIRNAPLDADWEPVTPNLAGIARSSVQTLIHNQGIGDLYRFFATAVRDGAGFNLAVIPPEFDHPRQDMFDEAYMGALFDVGYRLARDGYPWLKAPPGFVIPEEGLGARLRVAPR